MYFKEILKHLKQILYCRDGSAGTAAVYNSLNSGSFGKTGYNNADKTGKVGAFFCGDILESYLRRVTTDFNLVYTSAKVKVFALVDNEIGEGGDCNEESVAAFKLCVFVAANCASVGRQPIQYSAMCRIRTGVDKAYGVLEFRIDFSFFSSAI